MTIPVEGLYLSKALGLGRIAEHNPKTNIRSYAAEGDAIPFGKAVMDGTDPEKQCKLFASGTGKFRGIAGYSTEASDLDNSQYLAKDQVAVVDQGVVTVYAEEAVEIGNPVRIVHTGEGKGNFRASALPGNTGILTGAEWRESAPAGSAVKLYLDPPFTFIKDEVA